MLSSIVEEIRVFPAGHLWPLKRVAEFRQIMIEAGEDIDKVDHYINTFINAGLKRPRHHRCFSVLFKDRTIRIVWPNADDPTKYRYVKKYSFSDSFTEVESFQIEPTREKAEEMYPDLGAEYMNFLFPTFEPFKNGS